ncbi:MAG: MATE family efflux transporter [Endomicrobia bacterium]|nr:MATE family efflux transporter [Endomicrobiia bacterium]
MKKGNAPFNLGTENISKLLVQYAVPAVIAMTASSLYHITDSIFIGHGVGPMALSGLAITFPIMNLSAAFGSLIGAGGAALLSLRLGQKDYDAANIILGNVTVLSIVIGVLFSVLSLIFLKPMLYFFGASPGTISHAYDFMVIILAGNAVTYMFMGLNALLRSAGHPKQAMYATVYTVLINIVLNPLFIFGLGWGIRGSAAATVISQIIVLVWQFKFFASAESFIRFKKGIYRLKNDIVKGIVSIGLAPFMLNAVSSVIIVLINRQLVFYGGDLAVGAYGIVNRAAFLFFMIVFGVNIGMQPIAGYNYGAALYGRVSEVLKKSIILATLVMLLGFIVAQLFPHAVASAFTKDDELINLTALGLRIVFIFYPLIGFQMVVLSFFQSIGMAKKAIFLSVSRQVLFLIPLLIILPQYFGIFGVWVSMPVADLFSSVVSAWMLAAVYKQLKNKSSQGARYG